MNQHEQAALPAHLSLNVQQPGTQFMHLPHNTSFPWKPSLADKAKSFVISLEFRSAVQLTTGQLVVVLFVLINKLNFANSCLSSIFYVATSILVAQDAHVGSKLNAAAWVIGPLWFGTILAGCAVTLARACQTAFTGLLCLFTCLALFPVCLLRATLGPGVGIFSNLGVGVTIIQGQFAWAPVHGYRLLWKTAVGHILFDGLIAALGAAVGGLLALPSLASEALQMEVAQVLMKAGHSLSGYSTHLFQNRQDDAGDSTSGQTARSGSNGKAYWLKRQPSRLTALKDDHHEEEYRAAMHHATDPAEPHTARGLGSPQAVGVSSLRPLLAHCRALMGVAAKEPPFLAPPHGVLTPTWGPVLSSLDTLITKVAALESLLEDEDDLLQAARLRQVLGYDVLPVLQLVYAQMAAACAHLAKLLRAPHAHHQHVIVTLFGPSWSALEHELAHAMHTSIKGYWQNWQDTHIEGFKLPSPEVRALLYTSSLTNAIMEAMGDVETGVVAALMSAASNGQRIVSEDAYQQHHTQAARPLHEALSQSGFSGKQWVSQASEAAPSERRQLPSIPSGTELNQAATDAPTSRRTSLDQLSRSAKRLLPVSFRLRPLQQRDVEDFPSTSAHGQAAKPTRPTSQQQGWAARMHKQVSWLDPLLRTMLAEMCFKNLQATLCTVVPATCMSKTALRDTLLHGRRFQFFCKYWTAMMCSLCGCIILSKDVPVVREWSPLYVMITVIVVMSEKMDTTITKGTLRLVGTGIGGALGYLIMLRAGLATAPVALAALICCYTWLMGLFSMTEFKYAVFLTLITADAVVLCQFSPVPGHTGDVRYFYARCASIGVGVAVVWLFGAILPWFTYADALDTLGDAFKNATVLMLKSYEQFHDDVKETVDEHLDEAQKQAQPSHIAGLLEKQIAGPITRVQTALAKETVIWKRGILVMPKVVREVLQGMQVLLDRLSALQIMLHQKPVVSGHYTSSPYHNMIQPLDPFLRPAFEAAVQLGLLTAELLSERCSIQTLQAVKDQVHRIQELRLAVRKNYIKTFHDFCLEVKSRSDKPHIRHRTVDDAVRYLSFFFAASNALDKAALLANVVCNNAWVQRRCHRRWQATAEAWFGL